MNKTFLNKFMYNTEDLVESKENTYFWICVITSAILYLILTVSIIGILYVLSLALCFFIAHCLSIGHIKANSVKVTEKQFPQIYEMIQESCKKLEYKTIPDIYILQSGGVLNAFATKFLGKQIIILYSEIIELADKDGIEALKFIIAHELVHHKRKHLSKHIFLAPSMIIPFLGQAYSRACEYTCDAIAAHIYPQKAENGLLILLLGSKLYKGINLFEYLNTSQVESGFWSWFAEIIASHPHLYKRISRVYNLSNQLREDMSEQNVIKQPECKLF